MGTRNTPLSRLSSDTRGSGYAHQTHGTLISIRSRKSPTPSLSREPNAPFGTLVAYAVSSRGTDHTARPGKAGNAWGALKTWQPPIAMPCVCAIVPRRPSETRVANHTFRTPETGVAVQTEVSWSAAVSWNTFLAEIASRSGPTVVALGTWHSHQAIFSLPPWEAITASPPW